MAGQDMTILQNLKIKTLAWILKGAWEGDGIRRKILVNQIAKEINKMKSSWKTSIFGILSAIGVALVPLKDPAWLTTVGTILAAIGAAGIGLSARDNGVSSEQAGVKSTEVTK